MDHEEDISKFMNYLMENNALNLYGMTESGDMTYRFDFDVLEKIAPEFYKMMMDDINDSIFELYKKGYVDVEYDEELNAKFRLNEKGKKYIEKNKNYNNSFWEW